MAISFCQSARLAFRSNAYTSSAAVNPRSCCGREHRFYFVQRHLPRRIECAIIGAKLDCAEHELNGLPQGFSKGVNNPILICIR
jgi:hypothetical protein